MTTTGSRRVHSRHQFPQKSVMHLQPILGPTSVSKFKLFIPSPSQEPNECGSFTRKAALRAHDLDGFEPRSSRNLQKRPRTISLSFDVSITTGEEICYRFGVVHNGVQGTRITLKQCDGNWQYCFERLAEDLGEIFDQQLVELLTGSTVEELNIRARIKGCTLDDTIVSSWNSARSERVPTILEDDGYGTRVFRHESFIARRFRRSHDFPVLCIDTWLPGEVPLSRLAATNPFGDVSVATADNVHGMPESLRAVLFSKNHQKCLSAVVNDLQHEPCRSELEDWLRAHQVSAWNSEMIWSQLLGDMGWQLFPWAVNRR